MLRRIRGSSAGAARPQPRPPPWCSHLGDVAARRAQARMAVAGHLRSDAPGVRLVITTHDGSSSCACLPPCPPAAVNYEAPVKADVSLPALLAVG
jgi:hypothetical protein